MRFLVMQKEINTQHFKQSEFTHSDVAVANGICNDLPDMFLPQWDYISGKLEQLRMFLQHPIYINSGYRNSIVNKLVGGVPSSRHMFAEAVDITTRDKDLDFRMYSILLKYIPFRKCIIYPTFLHVEFVDGLDDRIVYRKW